MTPDLTPKGLAELRRKAEGATPGRWRASGETEPPGQQVVHATTSPWVLCYAQPGPDGFAYAANAAHIAAFDPPTALALLDRIEAQDRRIAELEARQSGLPPLVGRTFTTERSA